MSYAKRLEKAAERVIPALSKIGVDKKYLQFDGESQEPERIYVPSQSDSKFQAEQSLGDWAEDSLFNAINRYSNEFKAVHYGFNSKLFAEDDGFKEEYSNGIIDTHKNGKRADLLLFERNIDVPDDLTGYATLDATNFVKLCRGALEVRSSRLDTRRYIEYQAERLKGGFKPASLEPNFTVKIEYLIKVYLWIHINNKPQAYVQVFFDEIWGIGFLEIMEFIGSQEKLRVEKHKRSSKTTIMIPISNGFKLGIVDKEPTFEVVHNLTKNGRHDIFAKPSGGSIAINPEAIVGLLK